MVKLNSAKFLSSKNVQGGEEIEFLNEGGWIVNQRYKYPDGNPKQDFQIKVKIGVEERILNLNKTNRDILAYAWGEETQMWIGKVCGIKLSDCLVSGQMKKIIILEPRGVTAKPIQADKSDPSTW